MSDTFFRHCAWKLTQLFLHRWLIRVKQGRSGSKTEPDRKTIPVGRFVQRGKAESDAGAFLTSPRRSSSLGKGLLEKKGLIENALGVKSGSKERLNLRQRRSAR